MTSRANAGAATSSVGVLHPGLIKTAQTIVVDIHEIAGRAMRQSRR
ncbi:hypothetical protein PAMC26577_37285 [Caballeronia sordidicola]|uniref:Uncharacterized protein n=1 Tax=Caballeronia sordidicola TaxID=196367 RepID=A0A2C9XUU9_CABSO|nr:hypothetical protein PAMC26577_37285 [Caballeronia sordidicola]